MQTLAAYFWRGDFFGLGMVLLALVLLAVVQVGLAIGIMFGMNKGLRDKLPEHTYGDFDFETFERSAFERFVYRLLFVFVGTTVGLHLLEYLIVCFEIRRHRMLWSFVMFVLEVAGVVAGLYFVFKLDRLRLAIIVAGSALVYLILISILRSTGYVVI